MHDAERLLMGEVVPEGGSDAAMHTLRRIESTPTLLKRALLEPKLLWGDYLPRLGTPRSR